MSKRRTRGRTIGRSSWYCVATRATTTPPPQSGQAAGAAARWVWSTRAGRRRHACRPYSAPGRRPGRPPRPWGRSLAKGAACRNPARRAASSCFLRRSLRRFHRSRSRSTPVNFSHSRSISRSCSRMRESRGSCLVGGRCGGTTQLCHTAENCTSTNFWIWPDQEATPVNEYPAAWLGGTRHKGGVTLHQALVWNVGTCRLDVKGEIQGADPQG